MFNILTDPIFRVVTTLGNERLTLPGLYAAMMDDRVQSVPALRPHHRHAFHAFLAQLGALALLTPALPTPPRDENEWQLLLRDLTPKWPDEAWSLIVPDLTRPAFLQPATIEFGLQPIEKAERTPDSIDMLATAKNHDVKAARIASSEPDAWLMALLTVQTMDGYGGGGGVLQGISRMNSGSGSRPCVGLAPQGGVGARLRRDITRLLEKREQILADNRGYATQGGIALLWLEPWVKEAPFTADRLDPYYIEVCRRIRLVSLAGSIIARTSAGKMGTRITPPPKGVTGDPWAPIDRKEDKVLTIAGSGWDYHRVAGILDPEDSKPHHCKCGSLATANAVSLLS